MRRPGVKPATSRSQVQRPTTTLPSHSLMKLRAGMSPLLRRPLTVPRLGADSEDQVCQYIASKCVTVKVTVIVVVVMIITII